MIGTLLSSCQKNDCLIEGRVLKLDTRKCGCCGGWIVVDQKGDTAMYFDKTENSVLQGRRKDTLAFNIRFNYREIEGPCKLFGREIICAEILD